MTILNRSLVISGAIFLAFASNAQADINASLQNACIKAETTAANVYADNNLTNEYSNLLAQHFNSTNCNGIALLERANLNQAEQRSNHSADELIVKAAD
ncbi:hypothetical protein [Aliiglaciecola sp. LCG003]|uniref:hypothetical protein n=1 Tax=Aliiglaciecola sp. LCG003 TaxID=3053655 RepID=UPI0025730BBA|nr:hypothetical protein [Aliiglaciecola sp. LCG003]WJG07919.1 hypothetical protein QR722_11150 [Aliiglaciecola sp. LCG003]